MTKTTKKVAMTIAGSDPSGGAGIAADLKTFMANGVYGCSVITALTAQNTKEYWSTLPVAGHMVTDQLLSVLTDIRPDAVKIGMLPNTGIMGEVADVLEKEKLSNVVVDPVMVSSSGKVLMAENAREVFVKRILPLCDLVTPNIPETAELLKLFGYDEEGLPEDASSWMEAAAEKLALELGIDVLVKGGHSQGAPSDYLFLQDVKEGRWLKGLRIHNPNNHGTGCTLSSAITANLAKGYDRVRAVSLAKEYLTTCLSAGLDLGEGRGPMDHGCVLQGDYLEEM
ncbi:MAG: bifunctional hydroxymethylpyrimidine kinase/phosphomethylpyrimidine kinase [Lachnospiraceae bacterium]|nr:bifunctional hydroxymethylpyrimidine kinase/phosphomethylpyrimidine kinase [Lachnospiraceae bacterium]